MVLHWLSYIETDAMSQTWFYTNTYQADAMSQTWSYTGSHNVADACPIHVLHWHTYHPNVMA
ncbi:hypothetical protein F383_18109 [Gossypium arboreum]|uniref:Uncharacterized protein n=1 Tax=Gossypium arboreum TaxID=29729 RepID=A0A0B0MKT6_GOSAR|nr:hypothetical protein F383_18109 [Gossypium arboreum]